MIPAGVAISLLIAKNTPLIQIYPPMIKITIREDLILKHANSTDAIFIAGSFNDWNCELDQFEYDAGSKAYSKVLDIPEDSIITFKFVNSKSNSWFNLPGDVLAIDQANSNENNIINISKLPYKNDSVKVEVLNKEVAKNYILLQEEQIDIDKSHHPNGLTNLMRSENFSNILLSTDNNDLNSISSSLKSTKLNFEGENLPSANLSTSTKTTDQKENHKYSLLKRIFGYK